MGKGVSGSKLFVTELAEKGFLGLRTQVLSENHPAMISGAWPSI